jgi:uncharacterized protein with HEPN domain
MKDKTKDNQERLAHIRKAVNEIETFTQDVSELDFLNNNILSSAVLFQFSVIGEAVIHIEATLLNKYEYPWYKVRAFRNLISHEYFNIKLDAVWEIIVNELPRLKQVIEEIVTNEFQD